MMHGTDAAGNSNFLEAFLGYLNVEQVRDQLQTLTKGLPADINVAYSDEYVSCAAALGHFEPAEFARLGNNLKGRGLSLSRWERIVRECGRQERVRLATDAKIARAAAAAHALPLSSPLPQLSAAPVDGVQLLDGLVAAITQFVHIDISSAWIAAIWCLFTYFFEAVETNPFLRIKAPAPGCGKSTLLKALRYLARCGWLVSRISPSSFARTMNSEHPSLLLDEGDAFLHENEIMRNVLDAASDPDTAIISISIPSGRKDWTPVNLNVFVPIAIASIGVLRKMQTIEDRSICIALQRATPAELRKLEKARQRKLKATLTPLAQKCARFAADHLAAFKAAPEPALPESWSGRDSDKAEPLVRIAELVGDPWKDRIRAALGASFGATDDGAAPIGVMLLDDVRQVFGSEADRFASRALCDVLATCEGRPWAEYGKARRPITQNQLARLLAPFEVRPDSIRVPDSNDPGKEKTVKGYLKVWFEDAFLRYLPTIGDSKRNNGTDAGRVGQNDDFPNGTEQTGSASKSGTSPYGEKGCSVVPDETAENDPGPEEKAVDGDLEDF